MVISVQIQPVLPPFYSNEQISFQNLSLTMTIILVFAEFPQSRSIPEAKDTLHIHMQNGHS